ncbi:MAG TPA: patatin-like phospholipase family protein, partial [Gemmataceae bacterium]|nr:patatin-like phospholipase family protein [Gemmataceae bacterium]
MKRILSIDGGGIRGLIPAVVCQKMEEWSKMPLHKLFDLIAGTSTGGILGMGLTVPPNGKPASDLVAFYKSEGAGIFGKPRSTLRQLLCGVPRYGEERLTEVLARYFGDTKISDAIVDVLVTTYDLRQRTPYYISRRRAKENNVHDMPMRVAGRATSAAPTYFTPCQVGERALVDGGIVANNPACLALAEAAQLWPGEEYLVVSLGTGALAKPI